MAYTLATLLVPKLTNTALPTFRRLYYSKAQCARPAIALTGASLEKV